jgi:hypothetical protein
MVVKRLHLIFMSLSLIIGLVDCLMKPCVGRAGVLEDQAATAPLKAAFVLNIIGRSSPRADWAENNAFLYCWQRFHSLEYYPS